MQVQAAPYDVAEFLENPEEMAAYLRVCIEEADGDDAFIEMVLGDIARAKGMTQIFCETGLAREGLYKALFGEKSPSFVTVLKVISAIGIKLSASAKVVAEAA
jgi:probable addiction module antidote protein